MFWLSLLEGDFLKMFIGQSPKSSFTSGFILCLLSGSASYHDTNEVVHEDETYTPQLDYKRKYTYKLNIMTNVNCYSYFKTFFFSFAIRSAMVPYT